MPVRAPALVDPAELADALRILEAAGELEHYLATRSPEVRAGLERVQAEYGIGWRAHPMAMAAHLTPGDVHLWPYVRLLSEKFRQAATGESPRQIWNLPARYGKSTVASQWGPAWLLSLNPRARLILTSYADSLALENARTVRDLLREHADALGVTLRADRRRADRFVTAEGGGILARGLTSGITGFGAGRGGGVIIDDPYKNWQEAHSPTVRKEVESNYRSVLRLRLDDPSAFVIIVHTRWHEHDLTGVLYNEAPQGWDLVRLPAIAEVHDPDAEDLLRRLPDPLGRQPGEPIERERFTLLEVKARADDIGSYLAAALEQQRPAPEEGGDLRRDWWKWHDELPPAFETSCTSWDMKLKEADAGDYVVGQAWGRIRSDYWLRGQLRGRWNLPTVRAAIALLSVRHPDASRHFVENTGNGPEVIKELRAGAGPGYHLGPDIIGALGMRTEEVPKVEAILRRGLAGIIAVNPKGSKVARVRAITGRVEAGNVHLVTGDRGAAILVNEAAAFPNAEHDDTVDAMTQALLKLGNVALSATSVSRRTATPPKPGTPRQRPTRTAGIFRAGGRRAR